MAEWKSVELFNDASSDQAQFSFDDYQFVWVDGRANNVARRVIIDKNGEIVASSIGIPHPTMAPEIVSLRFTDKNDSGTSIARGNILLISYTYINDQEEESNPSPVLVLDKIQYQSKGYYTKDGESYSYPIDGGEYVFDQNRSGSIESFVLNIKINDLAARRINVYVAEAEYVETIAPPSAFRLCTSVPVSEGIEDINVTISSTPSLITASYENDLAPKGDAISLIDGVTFVGNAVNSLGIPSAVDRVWAITISNRNKYNYINRWVRIDLFDETAVNPIGSDIFDGIEDWSLDNKALYRIMDSDLTTPLDVYHYPIGSDIEIHKQIHLPSEGSSQASLTVGEGQSEIKVTSTAYGSATNSLSLEMVIGTTSGWILCDALNGNRIMLVSYLGVYHVSVELKAPTVTGDILIEHNVIEGYKHEIVITPASTGTISTSTAFDIIQAIALSYETIGGELYEIISDVYAYAENDDFDDDLILPGGNPPVFFGSSLPYSVYSGDKLTVFLAYAASSSSSGHILTTALQVANTINSFPSEVKKMSAIALSDGYGTVSELSETNLSGGTGDTVPAPTSTVKTRMLAWIRIPILEAYQDKTIYLTKLSAESDNISGEFTELIASGTPASGQMLLSEFYGDRIEHNPIQDEETLLADRAMLPDYLSAEQQSTPYTLGNAANLFLGMFGDVDPGEIYSEPASFPAYDEYAKAQEETIEYAGHRITTENNSNISWQSGYAFPLSGHAWSRSRVYEVSGGQYTKLLSICSAGSIGGSNTEVFGVYYMAGGFRAVRIKKDNFMTIEPYIDMTGVPVADGDEIAVLLSWNQGRLYGSATTISLAVIMNGRVFYAEQSIDIAIDQTKMLAIESHGINAGVYSDSPTYPAHFGVRVGQDIANEWQAINVLRFMPLYPTEGIGVYDEFAANEAGDVSCVNKNIAIDVLQQQEDTRPGRIQWGRYGSMPNLNEYSINENIMGLSPIKSFQPTDEHNTILIFTKNNTAILALLGDSAETCTVTRQLTGIGLISRDAICVLHTGVAWLSQQGIMIITKNGIVNVSRGIIDTDHVLSLAYDGENNWIWARGDGFAYVYQVDEKVWWEASGSVYPDNFLGCINDQTGWISYDDKIMYKASNTPHSASGLYPTLIKTRAVAMVKKLGRINLIGKLESSTYKLRARMFSNLISGVSTQTAEYETAMNSKTAIPGVGADYVQLDIKGANNIVAVAIEYEDGVK